MILSFGNSETDKEWNRTRVKELPLEFDSKLR